MRYAPHTHAPLTVYEVCFREGFALFREGGGEAEDRVVGLGGAEWRHARALARKPEANSLS